MHRTSVPSYWIFAFIKRKFNLPVKSFNVIIDTVNLFNAGKIKGNDKVKFECREIEVSVLFWMFRIGIDNTDKLCANAIEQANQELNSYTND